MYPKEDNIEEPTGEEFDPEPVNNGRDSAVVNGIDDSWGEDEEDD